MHARLLLGAALAMTAGQVRATGADAVDDYLAAEIARNHVPGLSVAVVKDGRTLKLKSYGLANLEWEAAATPDTAYPLASATKPLTGTLVMKLVADGVLSLDDPVAKHLPGTPESWRGMTVRHLATHTSGVADDIGEGVATLDDAIRSALQRPLTHPPGESGTYGIGGFVVLMRLLETVTGKSFPALLRERVLDPLGMTQTRFDNASETGGIRVADLVPRRSSVYEWSEGRQRVFALLFPSWTYTAGGLYSSAADLAAWAAALDGERILKRASLEEMWTPARLISGRTTSFAIGWALQSYRGRRAVGHSGGPALADILRFPDEKLTVVVLASQQKMLPYLAQGVADHYVPAPPPPASEPVEDGEPQTTERLRSVLTEAARGQVDVARFTPDAQRQIVPVLRDLLPAFLQSLGPLQSFVLIEESRADATRTRRYRARFRDRSMIWSFTLSDGLIASVEPTSE
jgi:CubicO group peptidase (beta-lactamase class C family)